MPASAEEIEVNHQSDYGYLTGAVSMRCTACGSMALDCCDGNGNAPPTVRIWAEVPGGLHVQTETRERMLQGLRDGEFYGFSHSSRSGDVDAEDDDRWAVVAMQVGDRLYCGGGASARFVVERVS